MNIIGLGSAGCNIADEFEKYPQYKIFKIDVDIQGDNCYNVVSGLESAEDYENYDFPKIKTFFKKLKKDESMFILGGSGKISCASLRILENIKKHTVSIIYIRPDLDLLTEMQLLREKVVFNVLQEYARSGVFKEMMIVSNLNLDSVIGGAPITGYYRKLNEVLVSTIHMMNVFKNTEPGIGRESIPKETHRISTIGLFDIEKGEEKMFFPLDSIRERCYIYSINNDRMKTDNNLYQRIRNQVKSKKKENLNISFTIYSSEYEDDFGYVIERTPIIQ